MTKEFSFMMIVVKKTRQLHAWHRKVQQKAKSIGEMKPFPRVLDITGHLLVWTKQTHKCPTCHILLVCTWRHGGYVGGQEQRHFSSLGTKLYFHVNLSRKNFIVLTTTWPPCHVVANQEHHPNQQCVYQKPSERTSLVSNTLWVRRRRTILTGKVR